MTVKEFAYYVFGMCVGIMLGVSIAASMANMICSLLAK